MRQTCSTDHQRHGVSEHVDHAALSRCREVFEAEISYNLIKLVQQVNVLANQFATQTQLRKRVASQLERDEHSRNGVSEDQYAVLSDLGVGDTFHTTEYRINPDHEHADVQTEVVINFEEAGECNTNTFHLTDNVSQ